MLNFIPIFNFFLTQKHLKTKQQWKTKNVKHNRWRRNHRKKQNEIVITSPFVLKSYEPKSRNRIGGLLSRRELQRWLVRKTTPLLQLHREHASTILQNQCTQHRPLMKTQTDAFGEDDPSQSKLEAEDKGAAECLSWSDLAKACAARIATPHSRTRRQLIHRDPPLEKELLLPKTPFEENVVLRQELLEVYTTPAAALIWKGQERFRAPHCGACEEVRASSRLRDTTKETCDIHKHEDYNVPPQALLVLKRLEPPKANQI